MKLINEIWTNLRDRIKFEDLDGDLQEKIEDGYTLTLYKCDDCDNIFEEENGGSKRVNMEVMYGVASLFPDSHYQDLLCCPRCDSLEIRELGTFNKEDFEDEELNESMWKRIAGKRQKFMDQGYDKQIETKLLPMLNSYGIKMNTYPSVVNPGKYVYSGKCDDNTIRISFYNSTDDNKEYSDNPYSMLVNVSLNGESTDAGVIDLTKEDSINDAFSLITMTLEDLGLNLFNKQEEEKPEEDDEDVKSLMSYREEKKSKEKE